jgi:hypothetical protein
MGGRLDLRCPNGSRHGVDRHEIDLETLICLLDRQFSTRELQLDLDLGRESLCIHGKCGALFQVTLLSHGYTFVAEGIPVKFVTCSLHEESVYSLSLRYKA